MSVPTAIRVALGRVDAALADLLRLRDDLAELLGTLASERCDNPACEDDPADFEARNLIDVPTAAERFCRPQDSIRYWCRERGMGIKIDGTWWVSAPRVERYLASRRE